MSCALLTSKKVREGEIIVSIAGWSSGFKDSGRDMDIATGVYRRFRGGGIVGLSESVSTAGGFEEILLVVATLERVVGTLINRPKEFHSIRKA